MCDYVYKYIYIYIYIFILPIVFSFFISLTRIMLIYIFVSLFSSPTGRKKLLSHHRELPIMGEDNAEFEDELPEDLFPDEGRFEFLL